MTRGTVATFSALAVALGTVAEPEPEPERGREALPDVVIHPFTAQPFACSEHPAGEPMDPHLGNALGSDCMVAGITERNGRESFLSMYATDGLENEDYFGWREPVLAPMHATVTRVEDPPEPNRPGEFPEERFVTPGTVEFEGEDGTRVVYFHVREIDVEPGDRVREGEPFARVGNNGNSYGPHVHVGAWRGETPLQIRFDLEALGELRGHQ